MNPFRPGIALAPIIAAGAVLALTLPTGAGAMLEERALEHAKQYQKERCGDSGRRCINALEYGPWCERQPPGKGRGQWGCDGWALEAGAYSCEITDAWSAWGNLIPRSGRKRCYPPLQNWRRR